MKLKFANQRIPIAVRWKILVIDSRKIQRDAFAKRREWGYLPISWDRLMAVGCADARALKTLRALART